MLPSKCSYGLYDLPGLTDDQLKSNQYPYNHRDDSAYWRRFRQFGTDGTHIEPFPNTSTVREEEDELHACEDAVGRIEHDQLELSLGCKFETIS